MTAQFGDYICIDSVSSCWVNLLRWVASTEAAVETAEAERERKGQMQLRAAQDGLASMGLQQSLYHRLNNTFLFLTVREIHEQARIFEEAPNQGSNLIRKETNKTI